MAGDWIKFEHSTPHKPEVFAIADAVGLDADAVVGKLIRVWIWADQQTYDGSLPVTASIIDRVAGHSGFADAMRVAGWLGANGFPNFSRHNGRTAKRRADNAKRVSAMRARRAQNVTTSDDRCGKVSAALRRAVLERDGAQCVYCGRHEGEYQPGSETARDAVIVIDHVLPVARGGADELANLVAACASCNGMKSDRTPEEAGLPVPKSATDVTTTDDIRETKSARRALREEKRRDLGSTTTDPSLEGSAEQTSAQRKTRRGAQPDLPEIPATLNTPEFRGAWADWLADRAERRKPVTARAAATQLADLAVVGPQRAVETIRRSIAAGWQGLFPESTGGAAARSGTGSGDYLGGLREFVGGADHEQG